MLFSAVWSSAFAAVKLGLHDCPPLLLMALRFAMAGPLVLLVARARGATLPARWEDWRPIVVLGLLNHALYLGVTSIAVRHLSAGLAAILGSTNPVLLALVAPWLLAEPLTPRKLAGLLTSFAGVAWVMWGRVGADNAPWAMALFLGCVGFMVAGTILFKRWRPPQDLLVVNGGQLLAGGAFLLPVALGVESLGDVRWTWRFLAAQAWLVLAVSGAAMALWFWLLRHGDATRASAYFFLNPVAGLLLGAALLGEPLGVIDVLGSAAVALGIYVVQRA